MTTHGLFHRRRRRRGGQALVEFSLALVPFLLVLMAIFDLGRGIYMNNGVSEAAREIARVTAVHPCKVSPCTLGNSLETAAVIAVQKGMIPGFSSAASSITFTCTTIGDAVFVPSSGACPSTKFIKVTITVPYSAITPLLSMVAPTTLTATAHVEVP
jgi:Flp pilus assembly protein TadG